MNVYDGYDGACRRRYTRGEEREPVRRLALPAPPGLARDPRVRLDDVQNAMAALESMSADLTEMFGVLVSSANSLQNHLRTLRIVIQVMQNALIF